MKNIFRGKSRILEPGAEVEFPPLVDGGENRAQMVHIHIGNFSATCVLWLGKIYLACAWARDESWQLWIGSWCFNTEKFVAFFLAVLEMSVEISQLWENLEILWNQLKLPHAIAVELSRSSFHSSIIFRCAPHSPHIYCAHFHINRFFDENAEKFFASSRI